MPLQAAAASGPARQPPACTRSPHEAAHAHEASRITPPACRSCKVPARHPHLLTARTHAAAAPAAALEEHLTSTAARRQSNVEAEARAVAWATKAMDTGIRLNPSCVAMYGTARPNCMHSATVPSYAHNDTEQPSTSKPFWPFNPQLRILYTLVNHHADATLTPPAGSAPHHQQGLAAPAAAAARVGCASFFESGDLQRIDGNAAKCFPNISLRTILAFPRPFDPQPAQPKL